MQNMKQLELKICVGAPKTCKYEINMRGTYEEMTLTTEIGLIVL